MPLEGVQLVPPRWLPIAIPVPSRTRIKFLLRGRSTGRSSGRSSGVSGIGATRRGRVCDRRGAAVNNSRERTRNVVVILLTRIYVLLKAKFAEAIYAVREGLTTFVGDRF